MKETFEFSDVEVAWNGITDRGYIDIDLHDDTLPEEVTSVVVRLQLRPREVELLVARLMREKERHDKTMQIDSKEKQ